MLVNGEQWELQKSCTLEEFLLQENYRLALVAVELNGKIIRRSAFGNTELKAADRLEIVSFVGGG